MLSIIIPVYNVEQYLKQCIDSILDQTYKAFELLLVNDGSTDNSGTICDEYAKQDLRVRVFHKSNAGVSSARNLGLEVANGKYITFIDSDDWVDSTYLEDFHLSPSKSFIMQGVKIYTDEKNYTLKSFGNDDTTSVANFLNQYRIHYDFFSCFSKVFSREIIGKLKFDETLDHSEDCLFVLTYLFLVDEVSITAATGYHYRYSSSGLSKKTFDFNYDLILYRKIKNVFMKNHRIISSERISVQMEEFTWRVLKGIYASNTRTYSKLEQFYKIGKNDILHNYKGVTGRGKMIYWFLKHKQIGIANLLLKF